MLKKLFLLIAPLTLLCSVSNKVQAGNQWSVAGDFSITNGNPNGAWSYGFFNPSSNVFHTYTFAQAGGLRPDWNSWSSSSGSLPVVTKNTGSQDEQSGTVFLGAGQLLLHPGSDGSSSVIRWTAPKAGNYLFDTTFMGTDVVGTTTDVHILRNGVSIWDSAINGFLNKKSSNLNLSISSNDHIDFVVGYGSNQTYFFDSTALSAVITEQTAAAPEPASMSLLAAGALGMLGYRMRKRKTEAATVA